ncbi:MAG: hypothetical protein KDJ14_00985 [Xanthomonadales bacterium]|nr:hypothetical protein [Xanthomonadales bacterium]
MPSASTLLGAAGEYYVMSQLLRRGFIAALAPAGVPNADIVVTDEVGDRLCAVQVKSRVEKGSDGGWHMRDKHESVISPHLFYVFVDFGKSIDTAARSFVIPSETVASALRRSHALWLATPGKKGQQRRDSKVRRLLPDYDSVGLSIGHGAGWMDVYREGWELLRR